MESEKIFHNWMVAYLKSRLARDYPDIGMKDFFGFHFSPKIFMVNY